MAYRDSEPAAVTAQLSGVWVMDPDRGGQDTARHYPYGPSQREEDLDPMGEATFYAGRRDPVVDYGEHESYAFRVQVDVPHGPTWRTDVEDLKAWGAAKKVLHVRDNRGRAVYGYLDGVSVKDAPWGTQVSFTVTRASRVQEVVTA